MNVLSLQSWIDILNSKNVKKEGIVFSSSGTTGNSKSIKYTKYVINGSKRRLKELLKLIDIQANRKVVILWGYGLFPPSFYYTMTFTELDHTVYPLGSGKNMNTEHKMDEMKKIMPNIIIGMPSYILKIFREAKINNQYINLYKDLDFIITGGELLTSEIRDEIESLANVKIYDSYGMLHAPMIASECRCGKLHLSKEYNAEVITKNKKILKYGEGTLLLSSSKIFDKVKMKKLETSDNVKLINEKCACRYRTKIIEIIGRDSNSIKIKGQIVDFNTLISELSKYNMHSLFYIKITKNPVENIQFYVSPDVNIKKFLIIVKKYIKFNFETIVQTDFSIPSTCSGKSKVLIVEDTK